MDDISESEIQKRRKYRDHDITMADLSVRDIDTVREAAIRGFKETRDSDNVTLIISAFIGHLAAKGYRIVKLENLWKRELDDNMKEVNVLYDPYGNVIKREYPKFAKKEMP